jgi:hypothetical protein
MARAGLCVAVLLAGCGLVSRDYDVDVPFLAGGAPEFNQSIDSSQLTGALSADVSKISSVTLKAARIEARDPGTPITFISSATISVSAQNLPAAVIATMPPVPTGATSVALQTNQKELKPYLLAGGQVVANITYSPLPATGRELHLVLTLHGSLL